MNSLYNMVNNNLENNLWQESHELFHQDEIAELKKRILDTSETDVDSLFAQAYATLWDELHKNEKVWQEESRILDEKIWHEEAIVLWMKTLFEDLKKSNWKEKIIADRLRDFEVKLDSIEYKNKSEKAFAELLREDQLTKLWEMTYGEETESLVAIAVKQEQDRIDWEMNVLVEVWVKEWRIPLLLAQKWEVLV